MAPDFHDEMITHRALEKELIIKSGPKKSQESILLLKTGAQLLMHRRLYLRNGFQYSIKIWEIER